MPRKLALIAISLACQLVQWYSYGGSWKWVTILSILIGILKLLFAICFCIPSYVHQQLLSLDCQNFVHYNSSVFYLSWELSWCRISFLKGDLQFSKFLKNTICIGLCKLKCTEKRLIPFTPLHFLPQFVPHTEFKGRPEDATWNVLYHTSLRNYPAISLQVPSILSILLGVHSVISNVQFVHT